MMKRIFLTLLFLQASFAADPSIEAALKCIEKKKMDVHAVEKINGKVGSFLPTMTLVVIKRSVVLPSSK